MEELTIIAGLGNPGAQYSRTRHNAGFLVLDVLARQAGAEWSVVKRYESLAARVELGGRRILLVKPQTFMNASGQAVAAALRYHRVAPKDLLVAVDDADLPMGTLRLRPGGSSGGHHGLESIAEHLGGDPDFARQRIGIGRAEPAQRDIAGHVLGRFDETEWPLMQKVFERASEQIVCWLGAGIDKAMNRYNGAIDRPNDERHSL